MLVTRQRTLKIGLAGLFFPIMGAVEHGIFEAARTKVHSLAAETGCTLLVWPEMIQSAADAEKAARFFQDGGIDFLLIQASSLVMGDAILPLVAQVERLGLWVVDEPTWEGELPLNSLTGFNLCVSKIRSVWGRRKKIQWFRGSGTDFEGRLRSTLTALAALERFMGSRIGSIGGLVPGFENLDFDPAQFESVLGLKIVPIALERLFRLAEEAPDAAVASIRDALVGQASCVRAADTALDDTARICFALDSIRKSEDLDACALRCWPEFQEWRNIAPCAALAWANDHCMPAACEGDSAGAAAMLLGRILSGRATTMNDPVALDDGTQSIQMWHCGPGPASWADAEGQCLDYHHTLNRRLEPGRERAGLSSDIQFAQGPVTALRIRGDGCSLFVLEGGIIPGPARAYPGSGGWIGRLRMRGTPVSPEDLLQMMTVYGLEHHYPLIRGHHEATLREMAGWAGWKLLPRLSAAAFPDDDPVT